MESHLYLRENYVLAIQLQRDSVHVTVSQARCFHLGHEWLAQETSACTKWNCTLFHPSMHAHEEIQTVVLGNSI